jgi:hypothetical protein
MDTSDMTDVLTPLPSARGNWVEYSTTEQRVGTWIDGKSVYQKTIKVDSTSVSNSSFATVALQSGIDELVDDKVHLKILSAGTAGWAGRTIPQVASASGTFYNTAYVFADSGSNDYVVSIINHSGTNLTVGGYVTIQYTKTTD